MAAAKATTSMDISDIQRRMAQIRHDMHQEVQGAVEGARSLTDWRSLVKSHPWLSISVAAVGGYLVVPRRQSASPTVVAVGNPIPQPLAASAAREPKQERKRTGWGILGTALGLLAPVAVRAAQNYALGQFDQWLAQNPLPPVPSESPGGPTRASGPTDSTGPANRLRKYG